MFDLPDGVAQFLDSVLNSFQTSLTELPAAADKERSELYCYSEGNYYIAAGHTSNSVEHGITWEEAQREGLIAEDEPEVTEPDIKKP